MNQVELVTNTLSSLTVIALIMSAIGWLLIASSYGKKLVSHFKLTLNHFLVATYIVSMTATLGSLYFSEIAAYTPCKFCWYQRILMYPQVVLYMIAMILNDKKIAWYGIVLSAIGLLIASYHYLAQMGIVQISKCSTVGISISCTNREFATFGFVTIPLMAAGAFLLILTFWTLFLTTNTKAKKN